ncbi:hypothetical protein ACMAZF_01270 [Psychrobium sp. nBUS_13]|uniref:hypothetical protein n=1 Tax=Psychrobium sp. nBUS_13 TaxID=3395319 RepID=UPI003EBA8FFC
MIKKLWTVLAISLSGGMNSIFPKPRKSGIIPTDKPMPEVTNNNVCKPKRKPRKHNKKKRGF